MKKVLVVTLLLFTKFSFSQRLMMNDETTTVSFVTKFLSGRLEGTFKSVQGSAVIDTINPSNSFFKLSFSAATATTSDNQFGPALVSAKCFNSSQYPSIELSSFNIEKGTLPNHYTFYGQLKIKGTARKVAIPIAATPNIGGYDFNFTFDIERKHFGLKCAGVGNNFKVTVRSYGKKLQ